jgi:hypothetical protein
MEMNVGEMVNSVRNDVRQGAYDQEKILLLCDKVDDLLKKMKPQKNKFNNLSPQDIKESMEARDRAGKED